MTQKEINEFLENTKVYVNGKSKDIQEKLFSLGYKWSSGETEVTHTQYPFLFIYEDMSFAYISNMEYFSRNEHREISAEEILSLEITDDDNKVEGLVEEKTKPKFKVGDRVITDTNMKGKIIEDVEEGWYRVEFEPYNSIPQPNSIVPEESMSLVEEEVGLVDKLSSRWVNEFNLPEGYIFKDENGNIINATKIVLERKKKGYPKTYNECCNVLGINTMDNDAQGYKWELIIRLQELLIARDAYWKIAGEEMGLGKPWEPDWEGKGCYVIVNHRGNIIADIQWHANAILAFSTEEMRDAFYENFKSEIESCKELL